MYFNEDEDVETWVLTDPIIDRFCFLCEQLEVQKGISDEINPYRQRAERVIHKGFTLNSYSYDYDWRLSAQNRGPYCILFYADPEFYSLYELLGAMIEVWEGFRELNRWLETELGLNKLIPIYPFMAEETGTLVL